MSVTIDDGINSARDFWTKPSQHTKQRKQHRVELGPDALAVLQRMAAERQPGQQWLFPSESKAGHLTTIRTFWTLMCRRAGLEGIRIYDLRRTTISRMMAMTFPP